MANIRQLPDDVINKIAAGEVVERPASVVKELLENSIDAGAGSICIEIADGGRREIKVSDDGSGMEDEDALLSLRRHATSKISAAEDISSISTLGFRGEALSSIAAVSRLRLKTKRPHTIEGTEIECEAGMIVSKKPCTCPPGTSISVRELFYNVPARLKHLKSDSTELKAITDIVSKYSLIQQDTHIKLIHNGQTIVNSPAADLAGKIISIYGKRMLDGMLPLDYEADNIRITGYISKPEHARKDRSSQHIFLNGRLVRNDLIIKAVYSGYSTMLGVHMHPALVISINMPPSRVDVNVHPSKTEVRLSSEDEITEAVQAAVMQSLNLTEPYKGLQTTKAMTLGDFSFKTEKQQVMNEMPKDRLRILGQIMRTYIVVENEQGLVLIDQHAAQERVLYEKYLVQYQNEKVAVQQLVEPLVVELSPSETVLVEANSEQLARFGFLTEGFGKNALLLRGIPTAFTRMAAGRIFMEMLDMLSSDRGNNEKIIKKACRTAVKANEPLEFAELRQLITELLKSKQPYTCPHGRPTMISYSADDLEKMFKRQGF